MRERSRPLAAKAMYMDLDQALEQDAPRILTPEMAQEFPDLVADMKRHPSLQARWAGYIVKKAQVQAIAAASEQLEIWRANAEAGPRAFIDGLGQQVAAIAPRHMNYLCWKYGPSWFRDPDCLKDTLERHPEMKVASRPRRTTIVVDGPLQQFETRLPLEPLPEERGLDAGNGAQENPPAPPQRHGGEALGKVMKTVASRPLSSASGAPRLQTSGGH